MVDTFPNPYAAGSPLGDALKSLGQVIMSGPTDAERIIQAENALKLQRSRTRSDTIGGMLRQYGTPAFDRNAAAAAAMEGGIDPKRLATTEQYLTAGNYGVNDPRTTAAGVGAGESYGTTPGGFRENQARELYQFQNTPKVIGTNTGPVFATNQTAVGQPAVEPLTNVQGNAARVALSAPGGIAAQPPAVQRFIHADAKDQITHNYVTQKGEVLQTRDGLTAAATGAPLPPGGYIASPQGDITGLGITSGTKTKLQEQDIALQRLKNIGDYAQQYVTPQTVGIPGIAKGVAQSAATTVANVAKGLGYEGPQQALESMKQRALAGGMNPDLVQRMFAFDPNIPKIETAYHMLTLSGAEALAGGMGRASDRDMRVVGHMLGSPEALFATPESLKAKMGAVNDMIGIMRSTNQPNMPRPLAPAATAAPGAPAAPPPPLPTPGAPQMADPLGIR